MVFSHPASSRAGERLCFKQRFYMQQGERGEVAPEPSGVIVTSSQTSHPDSCVHASTTLPAAPALTEALLKKCERKQEKTWYLTPTGNSRAREAFIENTAFKT